MILHNRRAAEVVVGLGGGRRLTSGPTLPVAFACPRITAALPESKQTQAPRTGHTISFDIGALDALTQVSPTGRHVEDLTLTLRIIASPDGRDSAIVPVPSANRREVSLRGLRVTFYTDNGIKSPSPDAADTVRTTPNVLSNIGVSIADDRPNSVSEAEARYRDLFSCRWWGVRPQPHPRRRNASSIISF